MHLCFPRRHSIGRYARLAFTNFFVVIIFCECSVFPVSAYDTGHHTDLTRNALLAEGFNEQAIRVVVLQNWLTDLYGAHPLAIPGSEIKAIKGDVEKLHFDNLFSTQEVRNYWIQLIANTQSAVSAAASREGDELRVLALIGISLHAVQDFYSHSNWIDIYQRPGDPFRPTTWIDVDNSGGIPLPSRIQTGWYGNNMFPVQPPQTQPHSDQLRSGQIINGLNKDSYRRFAWDQAYAFSYAATRQWINAIRTWVDLARLDGGEFWRTRVAKFSSCSLTDEGELKRDLES